MFCVPVVVLKRVIPSSEREGGRGRQPVGNLPANLSLCEVGVIRELYIWSISEDIP